MIIVATIWHTGTHSIEKELDDQKLKRNFDWNWEHVENDIDFDLYDKVLTTFRDPFRVGASWSNRDLFPARNELWYAQWSKWALLPKDKTQTYQMADLKYKENQCKDIKGLHSALDENDMDYFYKYVPKELIIFAQGKIH